MKNIILFFNKLCIMFTVTTITYGIFNFIVAFTLIYIFIYFFIDLSNKKSDSKINEQLRKYQENISKE